MLTIQGWAQAANAAMKVAWLGIVPDWIPYAAAFWKRYFFVYFNNLPREFLL